MTPIQSLQIRRSDLTRRYKAAVKSRHGQGEVGAKLVDVTTKLLRAEIRKARKS